MKENIFALSCYRDGSSHSLWKLSLWTFFFSRPKVVDFPPLRHIKPHLNKTRTNDFLNSRYQFVCYSPQKPHAHKTEDTKLGSCCILYISILATLSDCFHPAWNAPAQTNLGKVDTNHGGTLVSAMPFTSPLYLRKHV